MRPVLARFENSWQIAFEIERIPGGIITVYVPGAPDPWSGSSLHDGGSYPSYRPSDVSSDENPQRLRKRLQRTTECLFQTQIAGPVS